MRQSLYKYAGGHRTGANVLRRVFGLGGSVDTPHTPKRRLTGGGGDVPRTPTHIKYKVSPELQDFFAGKSDALSKAGVKEFKQLLKQETGQEYAIFLDKNRRVVAAVRQTDVQYAKERGLKSADIVSIARKSGNADNFDTAFREDVDAVVKSRKSTPNAGNVKPKNADTPAQYTLGAESDLMPRDFPSTSSPKIHNERSNVVKLLSDRYFNQFGIPDPAKLPSGVKSEEVSSLYAKLINTSNPKLTDEEIKLLNKLGQSEAFRITPWGAIQFNKRNPEALRNFHRGPNGAIYVSGGGLSPDKGLRYLRRGSDGIPTVKSQVNLVRPVEEANRRMSRAFKALGVQDSKPLSVPVTPPTNQVNRASMPDRLRKNRLNQQQAAIWQPTFDPHHSSSNLQRILNSADGQGVPKTAPKSSTIFRGVGGFMSAPNRITRILRGLGINKISPAKVRTMLDDPNHVLHKIFNPESSYGKVLNDNQPVTWGVPFYRRPLFRSDPMAYRIAQALNQGDIDINMLKRVYGNISRGTEGIPYENQLVLRKLHELQTGKPAAGNLFFNAVDGKLSSSKFISPVSLDLKQILRSPYSFMADTGDPAWMRLLDSNGRLPKGYGVPTDTPPWIVYNPKTGKVSNSITPRHREIAAMLESGMSPEAIALKNYSLDEIKQAQDMATRVWRYNQVRNKFRADGLDMIDYTGFTDALKKAEVDPMLIGELPTFVRNHPNKPADIRAILEYRGVPKETIDKVMRLWDDYKIKSARDSYFNLANPGLPAVPKNQGWVRGSVDKVKNFARTWTDLHNITNYPKTHKAQLALGTVATLPLALPWLKSMSDKLGATVNAINAIPDAGSGSDKAPTNPTTSALLDDSKYDKNPDYTSGWWKAGGMLGGAIVAPWLVSSLMPKNSKGGILDTLLTLAAIGGGAYGGYKLGEWGHDKWGKA